MAKPDTRSVVRTGRLRAISLDQHWIELRENHDISRHLYDPTILFDDILTPLVNRRVRVAGHTVRGGPQSRFLVTDIWPETSDEPD